MKSYKTLLGLTLTPLALSALVMPGCSTAPPTQEAKENLSDESHMSYNEMLRADPSLQDLVTGSYAYAMFPSIGKGAAGVGGSYGRGEVYKQNKFIGYADVSQGSIGASLGGESFSELIVFKDAQALDSLMNNKLMFNADASAIALNEGAAKTAKFEHGIAVIKTKPKAGLMFDASIGGQQFTFKAADMPNQNQ